MQRPVKKKAVKTIAIAGGAPGVGKTNFTANLAVALQNRGKKVLIMDTATGNYNINRLLRTTQSHSLPDLLNDGISLDEIATDGPHGIQTVSTGGPHGLDALSSLQRVKILNAFETHDWGNDFLLVDMAAGLTDNAAFFCSSVQEIIVIASPHSTSIADLYDLIRDLSTRYSETKFHLLVNRAENKEEAIDFFHRVSLRGDCPDGVSLNYLGHLPFDESVPVAMGARRAFVDLYPWRPLSRRITELAEMFLDAEPGQGKASIRYCGPLIELRN